MKTLVLALAILFSCGARAEFKTVPQVDLARYVGDWYEIASKPVVFQAGCLCTRQRLSLTDDPKVVGVFNSCNRVSKRLPTSDIRGTATPKDSTNSKLIVDFNMPWKGDYWIIGLDADYRYAVVTDPDFNTLYVLSKTPTLAPELYEKAVRDAATQVDVSVLEKTDQTACTYP